jgi:colicin import membrane protein
MVERASDNWVSIALSVLLHGALLAALVYGWLMFREQRHPAPTPAIEATVVDARTLAGSEPKAPAPAAAPQPAPAPPPEDVGPPPPTPEQRAEREHEEAQQRQAQEQKVAEERAAAERAAAEKAAAEKAAAAKAAAAKAAADKAAAAQRAADEQDRREREADLQRSLAAEAHADVARNGAAQATWVSMIKAKITHAWLRPPTAHAGIDCMLNVTQVPGGEVTQVSIGACNGDQAVRDSIEAAVYRASPLPAPPDPSMFDRSLQIRFKPDSD